MNKILFEDWIKTLEGKWEHIANFIINDEQKIFIDGVLWQDVIK